MVPALWNDILTETHLAPMMFGKSLKTLVLSLLLGSMVISSLQRPELVVHVRE